MSVRSAEASELDQLARIWSDGWNDAHAAIVPAELVALRTFESFRRRLGEALAEIRVTGPVDRPTGFCVLKDDELYQLFVAADARGAGIAAALLGDAETRLAARGVRTAWLACAIGNDRAARFYEKHGWQRVGTMINQLDASTNRFQLEVWRYEKMLSPRSRSAPIPAAT